MPSYCRIASSYFFSPPQLISYPSINRIVKNLRRGDIFPATNLSSLKQMCSFDRGFSSLCCSRRISWVIKNPMSLRSLLRWLLYEKDSLNGAP